jgi:hypothetical protein
VWYLFVEEPRGKEVDGSGTGSAVPFKQVRSLLLVCHLQTSRVRVFPQPPKAPVYFTRKGFCAGRG